MTPVLKKGILAAAPRRARGFVAAYLSAASEVRPDRVLLTPEAYTDVRARFPSLPEAREYPPAEAAADAARWPAIEAKAAPTSRPAPRPAGGDPPARWGPLRWAELHARPLAYRGDALAEVAWLYGWSATLPRATCSCISHWATAISRDPPDLSSPLAYAQWGFERHNGVRRRLGQPAVPWAEAAAAWGWPAEWGDG